MSCRSLRINPTGIVREAATYRVDCAHPERLLILGGNWSSGRSRRARGKQPDPKGDRVVITMNGKFLPYKKW